MGLLRKLKQIYYRSIVLKKSKSVIGPLVVNHKLRVGCQLTLGSNVNFNGGSFEGAGEVSIGNNFYSGNNLRIMTANHDIHSQSLPYEEKVVIIKNVSIGDNVWIGDNVTLLPGTKLGDGCVIQYGSVVTGNIPELSIAGGHPAKVFAHRDADHYHTIKKAMAEKNEP